MAEQDSPPEVDPYRVALIVGSYVRHHQIGPDQLVGLIAEVHRALGSLGHAPPVEQTLVPAVSVRRSVQPDYVVCLECGYRARVLRRHLRVAHDLEVADYRTRWKLPADHPITAPAYSERRSTMAKRPRPQTRCRRVDSRSGGTARKAAGPQIAICSRGVARAGSRKRRRCYR